MLLFESVSIPQQPIIQKGALTEVTSSEYPPTRAFFIAIGLTMAKLSAWWLSITLFLEAARRALLPSQA